MVAPVDHRCGWPSDRARASRAPVRPSAIGQTSRRPSRGMIAALRAHGGTIAGGLALGGVVGVAASWLAERPALPVPPVPATPSDNKASDQKALLAQKIEEKLELGPRVEPGGGSDRLARWRDRWTSGTTSWHLEKPHPRLVEHLQSLLPDEQPGKLALFPLCGASVDLGFLARRGHHVVGVDGVPLALDKLCASIASQPPFHVAGLSAQPAILAPSVCWRAAVDVSGALTACARASRAVSRTGARRSLQAAAWLQTPRGSVSRRPRGGKRWRQSS